MINCSIIIVSYNTKNLLIKCIDSILKYEKNIEIIIVDNNSSDGTSNYIKNNYPQIVLIENNSNKGFAQANNQGIKVAKSEYILLLNSDTELISSTISELMQFMNKSNIGAIVPQLLNPDLSIQASVFELPTVMRVFRQYWFNKLYNQEKYVPKTHNGYSLVESAVMAVMMLRKDVINKVGLLDERYFMYYEDLEYCRRLQIYGFQIIYTDTVQVIHHHGASGSNDSSSWKRLIPSSKLYHGYINHYLIYLIIKLHNLYRKLYITKG